MPLLADKVLDLPFDVVPDPEEFIRAAMEWHFNPATGSPFWLRRAESLGFDPRAEIRSHHDLRRFPNVLPDLRDVHAEDLIARGYGDRPDVAGFFESGGTTGAPKRVVLMREWQDRLLRLHEDILDRHGIPRGLNWLGVLPSGPHIIGALFRLITERHGSYVFTIDLDPRWVKKLIAQRRLNDADAYAEHIIDQAADILRRQNVGALNITPPLLERLSRHRDLVDLVNEKVRAIMWGGAHMDADTLALFRTEVFPETIFLGQYGSTMYLGSAAERPNLPVEAPCIFDPYSPYLTFEVVNPDTLERVGYGDRGQILASHVSKGFLLPNNLERDMATRIKALDGTVGDAVADVAPVATFENEAVIEGVY
ncbi:phenazine antibiotic biosynthesis protein [Frankia sp. R43]|uniref:AMP-binding protein n=1 Tax=Frankia sp. R43 TaxID=269536 RepID=UPI0006CA2A1E|nr:AMP-binding protein [Frankia sp. R43]KPM53444.1 phenazine antibiotic biosynthesis protein [Frankia sp. R43]